MICSPSSRPTKDKIILESLHMVNIQNIQKSLGYKYFMRPYRQDICYGSAEKSKLREEFNKSPRCVIINQNQDGKFTARQSRNRRQLYSWKNYLKPEVSDQFDNWDRQSFVENHRDYSQILARSKSSGISRISERQHYPHKNHENYYKYTPQSVGINTDPEQLDKFSPSVSYGNFQKQRQLNKSDRQMMRTQISGDISEKLSELDFKSTFKQHSSYEKKEEKDDYGLRLKLEEREYLMRKFMEHVEDIHHYKL